MRFVCTVILLFGLGIACAHAGTVTATGVAPILDQQVAEARKVALDEAKRAAVEQALGTYVESRTEVEDFTLASDTIYTSVKGRIDRYEVTVDEAQPGDLYRVEIIARFEDALLLSETEKLLNQHHWHKKPRLLIEITGGGDSAGNQVALQVQERLQKKFRRGGFDVFEADSRDNIGAGFLLQGSTHLATQESDFQGVALKSNELQVTVSLKRIGSGQVISSASFSDSKPGSNQARAYKAMSKEAANRLYSEISYQMNEEWLSNQSRGSDIVLQLTGQGLGGKVPGIKSGLDQAVRGLQSISTDSVADTSAVLSVVYVGWPEQFYDELSLALEKNKKLGLVIDGMNGNALQLRIL